MNHTLSSKAYYESGRYESLQCHWFLRGRSFLNEDFIYRGTKRKKKKKKGTFHKTINLFRFTGKKEFA